MQGRGGRFPGGRLEISPGEVHRGSHTHGILRPITDSSARLNLKDPVTMNVSVIAAMSLAINDLRHK